MRVCARACVRVCELGGVQRVRRGDVWPVPL